MQKHFTRRRFLTLSVVSAGVVCGTSACGSSDDAPEPLDAARFFPQSVASGDPRPTSVVFWTRALDPDRLDADLELEFELATDPEFASRLALGGAERHVVTAEAEFDHCVKLRVDELEPGTVYYYRFRYRGSEGTVESRVGRTKTAPAPDSDARVRFAVACCQDYDEKYYHAYRLLEEREIDFVVHLGDYVYESVDTSGAPGARRVIVGRPDEVLLRGESGSPAARSLDNYRDLYRTIRSDRDLQGAHERFPFIVIWDDHEFSNDCYGARANYEDGRADELDLERRRAADRAWFEYMPVDYQTPPAAALDVGGDAEFPDDFAIHRSFVFGRHLELVMTDLRRYRPDHVVPEDAFPGALFVTEAELEAAGDPVPDELVPAIDVDAFAGGAYGRALREDAAALDIRAESASGLVSVPYLNDRIAGGLAPSLTELGAIDPAPDGATRGYAVHQLLKTAQFSGVGARYLLASEPFAAFARRRFRESGGASERMMGEAQRAWFLDTLQRSTRTFKVWGSELCFMPRAIDLRGALVVPEWLRARINVTAEDWDGCPNERAALFAELAGVSNVVVLSGDLHCFFAGVPFDAEHPERRFVEITTGSVSSTTWLRAVRSIIEDDPTIPEGAALAASAIGGLLMDPVLKPNPHLAFQELERNGVSVCEVGPDALTAELLFLTPDDVATPELADLAARVTSYRLRVPADGSGLDRELDGRFWRWDTESVSWILLE